MAKQPELLLYATSGAAVLHIQDKDTGNLGTSAHVEPVAPGCFLSPVPQVCHFQLARGTSPRLQAEPILATQSMFLKFFTD